MTVRFYVTTAEMTVRFYVTTAKMTVRFYVTTAEMTVRFYVTTAKMTVRFYVTTAKMTVRNKRRISKFQKWTGVGFQNFKMDRSDLKISKMDRRITTSTDDVDTCVRTTSSLM